MGKVVKYERANGGTADTPGLGSGALGCEGANPSSCTMTSTLCYGIMLWGYRFRQPFRVIIAPVLLHVQ